MKTKTAMILILLASMLMLAAPVMARAIDDEWFIDKAITNVEANHELEDLDVLWNGVVTSGFEIHFRPYAPVHKHASIVGSFGFAGSGYVQSDLRVYVAPWRTVYEISYSYSAPRSPELSTDVVNGQYQYSWDGKRWVMNTPIITRLANGRTRVYYPPPE